MLAVSGAPFDSDNHFYEIKGDGIRALALVERGGWRLWSRNEVPLAARFPELEELAGLPPGTALDGEIAALRDGVPDLGLRLRRMRAARPGAPPVAFVALDILYRDYAPLLALPLRERRLRLEETLAAAASPRTVLSEGATGSGRALFRQACGRRLEGVMAKRVGSTCTPGRRSAAWVKIKRRQQAVCAIIGYIEKDRGRDFQSLLVAVNRLPGAETEPRPLRYVGRVGSGLSEAARAAERTAARASCSRAAGRLPRAGAVD